MTSFTKLVPEIIESSIWNESSDIRIVWITLLAKKDMQTGYVRGNAATVARMANVPLDSCVKALELFQQPDPSSHTPDNEGRRIAPADGGWIVLNNDKYVEAGMDEARRAAWREDKALQRKKKEVLSKKCPGQVPVPSISISNSLVFPVGESEGSQNEPDEMAFVEFCMSPACGITRPEAVDLYLKLKGRGWKDGNGAVVEDWRSYCRRMRKYIEQDRAQRKLTAGNGSRPKGPNI